ncbi:MAG: VanW family protein [Vampirovibrionia bacterium]
MTRPAPNKLGAYSTSIDGLTKEQRHNICLAAKKINNTYVEKGDIFSFNTVVGPRTLEQGFLPSKVIFEDEVVSSLGGGICLVSSTLYNAVIRSGLDVVNRLAHTKLVKSVPAGMDATVWYGINDFSFKNNTDSKVQVISVCSSNRLNIELRGKSNHNKYKIIVDRQKISDKRLQVKVFRKSNNDLIQLSEDIYQLD